MGLGIENCVCDFNVLLNYYLFLLMMNPLPLGWTATEEAVTCNYRGTWILSMFPINYLTLSVFFFFFSIYTYIIKMK